MEVEPSVATVPLVLPLPLQPTAAKQLIAAAAVVALHLWKKNTLLSIGAGTALYMLMIRL